jgi:hypothetical protein
MTKVDISKIKQGSPVQQIPKSDKLKIRQITKSGKLQNPTSYKSGKFKNPAK